MPEVVPDAEVPNPMTAGKPWLVFVERVRAVPPGGDWVREEAATEGAARQAATRLRGGGLSPLAAPGEFEVRRSGRTVFARLRPQSRS